MDLFKHDKYIEAMLLLQGEETFYFTICLNSDNPGQNLLRQIVKMPIFSYHPGKTWNLRQMNARFPPSPYPKLFRIAW